MIVTAFDSDFTGSTVHAIAQGVIAVVWDESATQTRGGGGGISAVHVDGRLVARPYLAASIPTGSGGARRVLALRWPVADAMVGGGGAVVSVSAAGGREIASATLSGHPPFLDPAAVLDGLAVPGRIRLLRFLVDSCRAAYRLGGDPAFAAVCRRLAAALVPEPSESARLCRLWPGASLYGGGLADSFGAIEHIAIVGAEFVRPSPHAALVLVDEGRGGAESFVLAADDRSLATDAASGASAPTPLLLLFGANGLAVRRPVPHADAPALVDYLARKQCPDLRIREYALFTARTGAAAMHGAALAEEAQIRAPLPAVAATAADAAVTGAIELAIGKDAGGLFLRGWVRDPHRLVVAAEVRAFLERHDLRAASHRFPRHDLDAQFAKSAHSSPKGEPVGFVAYLPLPDGAALHQPVLELATAAGLSLRLVPSATILPPAQARSAVLGSVPTGLVTDAMLDDCIGPAAARLHAAALAAPGEPDVVTYGAAAVPVRPTVSVIIPLYRNLSFLRFQIAAFAVDAAMRDSAEIVFVLDSPEQRAEVEHMLAGQHALYGMPMTLVVMPANLGYASANNYGAAVARGRHLLLLNSDVIPIEAGWLPRLVARLEAEDGLAAVGPKLLFEDGSLQHAGLFFGRDVKGDWYNNHFYKGYPRDYAPATVERSVPGVTGAAMLVRSAVYERVGGFTTDYIIGDYEDSDLCLKIRARGHDIRYVPSVELHHLERRSIELHAGYTRTVACRYNRRLHQARWADAMADVMGETRPAAPVAAPAAKPRRAA
jgi:GT2 family glycosyltransferase